MPEDLDLTQPLDDLSKKELKQLKLRNEIIKIRSEVHEIKKSWLKKNVGNFIVPAIIGIATVYTGYKTGYFNVAAIRLENQKHDLNEDIKSFTEKKDSLHLVNENLAKQTDSIVKEKNALISSAQGAIDSLARQGSILSHSIVTIESEKEKVLLEKNKLNESVLSLKEDVKHSSFNDQLKNILLTHKIDLSFYNLKTIVINQKESQVSYFSTITNIIDTSKDLLTQAIFTRLLYETTEKVEWKNKLFEIFKLYCADDSKVTFFESLKFFEVYTFGKNARERDSVITFAVGLTETLINKQTKIEGFLTVFGSLKPSNKVFLYLSYPKNYCFLVQKSKEFFLIQDWKGQHNWGTYEFLQAYAPIATIFFASELLKTPDKFEDNQRSKMINYALYLIGKNYEVLQPPSDVNNPKSWELWQQKYPQLMEIAFNIPKYCDNQKELIKIIGKN